MTVVTRFAPSPTGFLHIGGARTALFNWLYARHHGGTYLLRVEDTDRARSTEAAKAAILDGLSWLGLDWDGDEIYQSTRADRHAAAARALVETGHAYPCYATPEELAAMRAAAKAAGGPMRYDGRWRDRDPGDAPDGVDPVIRLKAPRDGVTTIEDGVQGPVSVSNAQLDDMVLLRANGTPTYMLAVVVDDHDMGITDVIRGDDHLTNAFRQTQLYRALGWEPPRFAHIPLIHGADGGKLSKRHGALGVDAYRDMGYLPEALCNYLLRLGWGHGDEEIIDRDRAIELFDLDGVGRSSARFDLAKLDNLNGHYLRVADDARLLDLITPNLVAAIRRPLSDADCNRLARGMKSLKSRANTILELSDNSIFLVSDRPIKMSEKAARLLDPEANRRLAKLRGVLADLVKWSEAPLEAEIRDFATASEIGLGNVAQPLRAALTGSTVSPGIFEIMAILGRDECLGRLDDAIAV